MALLIIFDVANATTRQTVINAIAHYGSCLRLGEASYAVKTNQSPAFIYDGLRLHLGPGDHVLVLPLAKPYTGGDARMKQWLDDHLTD